MAASEPFAETAGALRQALRSLVRPVAIVTAHHGGADFAMAATAFSEVSMDPPSMLVCVNRSNATWGAISAGADIGLNLLAEAHEPVSRHCGSPMDPDRKFEVGDWLREPGKPPRLIDSAASIRLHPQKLVEHGTHGVVIGDVVEIHCGRKLPPLAFHDGGYLFPLATAALRMAAQSGGTAMAPGTGQLMMDMMRAFHWFDEGLQGALRERGWEGVSRSQSMLLANVALGIRRPVEMARALGISRQAVSRMLFQMGQQGLVTVETDPEDRRYTRIGFSERSARLRSDALEILGQLEATLAQRIGPDGVETLRRTVGQDWGARSLAAPAG